VSGCDQNAQTLRRNASSALCGSILHECDDHVKLRTHASSWRGSRPANNSTNQMVTVARLLRLRSNAERYETAAFDDINRVGS
jgi:hypothetical protein